MYRSVKVVQLETGENSQHNNTFALRGCNGVNAAVRLPTDRLLRPSLARYEMRHDAFAPGLYIYEVLKKSGANSALKPSGQKAINFSVTAFCLRRSRCDTALLGASTANPELDQMY